MLLCQKIAVAAGRRMMGTLTGFSHRFGCIPMNSQQAVACQPNVSHRSLLGSSENVQCQPIRSLTFKDDPSTLPHQDPQKGDLVYIGTLARMVRFVKLFSLSTSSIGIAFQPFIYEQASNLHWALAAMVGGVAGFFIFVTPVILHIVTKRYVTAMYLKRDSGVFTASTYTLFLRQKDHSFKPEDVKIPTVPGIFTTIKIRDKVPLFVDPNLFIDKQAFIQMMKYDEPLDWEIVEESDAKKSSQ